MHSMSSVKSYISYSLTFGNFTETGLETEHTHEVSFSLFSVRQGWADTMTEFQLPHVKYIFPHA